MYYECTYGTVSCTAVLHTFELVELKHVGMLITE